MTLSPRQAMQMAMEEARLGAGFVSPNPLVGCVIVDSAHRFLAKGYHARLGDLHAETHALSQIHDQSALIGAHVYVTLEPCAHQGRQPSCAKTLARLPVASITYGLQDPNPLVAGQGAQILREAGKTVSLFPELTTELEELAEIFLTNMRRQRPFVAVKVASSLDGQVALADGTSQWITGAESRARVQSLRGEYDAILTGAGTFLKDNPRLNSRDSRYASKRQRVVLLDPDGTTVARLARSALLEVRSAKDVILVTRPGVAVVKDVDHVTLDVRQGQFDLRELMSILHSRGLSSLMVESGPQTVSAFFMQAMVDRLYLFLAPKLLGRGLGWLNAWQAPSLEQALGLKHLRVSGVGEDLLITASLSS